MAAVAASISSASTTHIPCELIYESLKIVAMKKEILPWDREDFPGLVPAVLDAANRKELEGKILTTWYKQSVAEDTSTSTASFYLYVKNDHGVKYYLGNSGGGSTFICWRAKGDMIPRNAGKFVEKDEEIQYVNSFFKIGIARMRRSMPVPEFVSGHAFMPADHVGTYPCRCVPLDQS